MLAYHFDEYGYFDGVMECQKDDLESILKATAVFLQPANSTKIKPPEPKEGFKIRWSGEMWEYEEIEQDPVHHEPTTDDSRRMRIDELQNYLNATDWYAVRFAETGVAVPDEIKAERQAAREEISRLREDKADGQD